MCVSGRIVDMPQILKEMAKVNFEVKEVMSQHSPYIDRIVRVGNILYLFILLIITRN